MNWRNKQKAVENPVEKLEIRLWPLVNSRYMEVLNPDALGNTYSDIVPTKVLCYSDRSDFMKEIHTGVSTKMGRLKIDVKDDFQEQYNNVRTYTAMGVPFVDTLIGAAVIDKGIVGQFLGSLAIATYTTLGIYTWQKERSKFKNRVRNLEENVRKFENTPINSFEVVKDEEMADIASAIERGSPLSVIRPKDKKGYKTVKNILRLGDAITPFPTDVYQQKLATYAKK